MVWAAGRKHSVVVQRLLLAGARPNSCDKYATSALTWAARAGDVVACSALLRAGADPNTAGMYCWTPLLQATHGETSLEFIYGVVAKTFFSPIPTYCATYACNINNCLTHLTHGLYYGKQTTDKHTYMYISKTYHR